MKLTYTFIALSFSMMLLGCMSEKKLAKKCSERFPPTNETEVRIREIVDTLEVPGEVVYVNCDSVIEWIKDPIVRVPCPPVKIITKTIVKDSIVKVENTAKSYALQTENNELKADVIGKDKEIATVKEDKNDWRKWAFIFGGAWVAFIVLKLILWYLKKQSGGLLR
jgi:hypothetical protein